MKKNLCMSVFLCFYLQAGLVYGQNIQACPAKSSCIINNQLAKNTELLDELIDKAANMLGHPTAFKDKTLGDHIYVEKSYKPGSFYPKNSLIKGLRLDYEGPTSQGSLANFQVQYGKGAKNQGGCYASINIPLNTKVTKESFKQALVESLKTGTQYCVE